MSATLMQRCTECGQKWFDAHVCPRQFAKYLDGGWPAREPDMEAVASEIIRLRAENERQAAQIRVLKLALSLEVSKPGDADIAWALKAFADWPPITTPTCVTTTDVDQAPTP